MLTDKQQRFCDGKKCSQCGATKPIELFGIVKRNYKGKVYINHRGECKSCESIKSTMREREKRMIDPTKAKARASMKYSKQTASGWRIKNAQKYRDENRESLNSYFRNYKRINPLYRVTTNLRSRLYHFLNGTMKSAPFVKLLGCDVDFLRSHLESKFQSGMSWDNYGLWHVDHIKPLSSFNLLLTEQQHEACHYLNLQPLWAKDNISKGGVRCGVIH